MCVYIYIYISCAHAILPSLYVTEGCGFQPPRSAVTRNQFRRPHTQSHMFVACIVSSLHFRTFFMYCSHIQSLPFV